MLKQVLQGLWPSSIVLVILHHEWRSFSSLADKSLVIVHGIGRVGFGQCHHFPKDHGPRVDIGLVIVETAIDNLHRHVPARAHARHFKRGIGIVRTGRHFPTQSKIQQLQSPIGSESDILRLEIAKQNVSFVTILQRRRQLQGIPRLAQQGHVLRPSPSGNSLVQRVLQSIQYDKVRIVAALLQTIEAVNGQSSDRQNVGMIQGAHVGRFHGQIRRGALKGSRILQQPFLQVLHGKPSR
mmetsp:Transcript_5622/g.11609  ORF Transcript_5622/g.11609 Transcript_5622/m.11609 type:complete len:239 (-) Transcript_5622:715-1431(-)